MDIPALQATSPGLLSQPWVIRAGLAGRYIRLEGWTSRLLPTPRDLFIYLPEVYLQEPTRRLPLLVMHDGQNLFDGTLSYVSGSTWNVGSSADEEIAAGRVAPLIILGVANTGVERMSEYTPTRDIRLGGGQGPIYARMLLEELIPMIAAKYPLLSGPEHTGIAGSSLGGLISLAIAMRYPHQFGKVGAISPSLWWDDSSILKDARSLSGHLPLQIWLDMGTAEGARHVRNADLLVQILRERGWQEGLDLKYDLYPDATHDEGAWAARFPEILRFLFPPDSLLS